MKWNKTSKVSPENGRDVLGYFEEGCIHMCHKSIFGKEFYLSDCLTHDSFHNPDGFQPLDVFPLYWAEIENLPEETNAA